MRVAAIVVSWNSAPLLERCLAGLDAQDHEDLEVLVVDNASEDGSAELVERWAAAERRHPVRLVRRTTNRGFAGGVNDGTAMTDAEGVLTCNPDVELRGDHVSRLVAALAEDPGLGAVQGKLLRPSSAAGYGRVLDSTGHEAFRTRLFRNRGEGEADSGQHDRSREVFGVSGACALYRRAMLDDVAVPGRHGTLEILAEDLLAYWEDVDLDWRAAMHGWSAGYVPEAVAFHERGGAGPRRTSHVEALNWRNRLLVLLRCDSPASLLRSLPGVLLTSTLKTVELGLSHPRALARGTWDLLRLAPRALRARRAIHAGATVPSAQVVERWFGRFRYRRWTRTWWARVRG